MSIYSLGIFVTTKNQIVMNLIWHKLLYWCVNFQGYVNYWFSEINDCHYAHEYFFHYNHGLNPKTRNYFTTDCPNNINVYMFFMCKPKETSWHIIHENRTLLKTRPHLTFQWPFHDISLTISLTYGKLYILWSLSPNE